MCLQTLLVSHTTLSAGDSVVCDCKKRGKKAYKDTCTSIVILANPPTPQVTI